MPAYMDKQGELPQAYALGLYPPQQVVTTATTEYDSRMPTSSNFSHEHVQNGIQGDYEHGNATYDHLMPNNYEYSLSGAMPAGNNAITQPGVGGLRPSPRRPPKRKRIISFDQRKAANIRERRRMLSLNDSFDLLRSTLPTFSYEKKLSRIETLRLALIYIAFMTDVLNGTNPKEVKLISGRSPAYVHSRNALITKPDEDYRCELLAERGHVPL